MNSTIIFQMCERDIEHLLHIFFDCKFAKDCWQVMNLEFNMANVENAAETLRGTQGRKCADSYCPLGNLVR